MTRQTRLLHPAWAWPRGPRSLLLEAALAPDEARALDALRRWTDQHDLDDITFADHRLLAAVAERHGAALAAHPAYPRLKGLQRQLWTQSRMRVHGVLPILKTMTEAGVEIMLLKGAARIALHPAAQRERSHQDIDILVRPAQMRLAAAILAADGWQSARGDTALAAIARISAARAINFQKLPWGDIDLHRTAWHGRNYHPDLDSALWDQAQSASYFGLPVVVPAAAERLAMTLSHGAWSPEAHSDWLVDAADILGRETIDWPRFAHIVRLRGLASQVRIGLSYLQEGLDIRLPDAAQPLIHGRCGWPTLLIARAPADLPKPLRPLRQLVYTLGRSRSRGNQGPQPDIAPLKLALARADHSLPQPQAVALEWRIIDEAELAPQSYKFTAVLRIQAPQLRRRVQFELNSQDENLARFRVFVAPCSSGYVQVRLGARVRPAHPVTALTLTSRPSCLLMPDTSAAKQAKRAALPFVVLTSRLG